VSNRHDGWDDGRVLDDLAALGPFFAVSSHPPAAAPVPPWRPASELTGPSGPLRDRIAAVRAALAAGGGRAVGEIEPRVAASAVHLGLVARLIAPALGAAVLRCPLDMRPRGLWWQDVLGGPVPLSVPGPDPVSEASRVYERGLLGRRAEDAGHGHQGTGRNSAADAVSAQRDSCADPGTGEWSRPLFEQLLAPVTAAIARLVPVSGRVLWGNVASAVNTAAAQVAGQRPDLAEDAWQAAGRMFCLPWLRDERHPPGPTFRRSSCCLFYRIAPENPSVCGDCVLARRPAR
jgi:FhuF 2Fe-2S C-terminal domain/Ferric iron reductase FhuF-like transporter